MLIWVFALAAGAASVVFVYGLRPGSASGSIAAVLRLAAMTGLVALLLNAALGAARPAAPLVALDVSASWMRDGDSSRFVAARAQARSESTGEILLFGDSLRAEADAGAGTRAVDRSSRVRPAVERAMAEGRPLRVYTDGELEDADALSLLVGGSGVVVSRPPESPDLAIAELRAPRVTVGGDTIEAEAVVTASGAGGPPARLSVTVGGRLAANVVLDATSAFAERVVRARIAVPDVEGALLVAAKIASTGDGFVANDSLATTVDVSRGAAAVMVSTSPDYDARELAAVLRGTVLLPTRGFYRVAPGRWREDGGLGLVADDEVRRVSREAPLLVLHGDTALFGDPRTFARGSILLVTPPVTTSGEWYATGAPPSPMSAALGGSPWDSLPPLDVAALPQGATFEVLESRRARRLERRAAAVGWERPRRVVLVAASGFWRWRFRGGAAAAVHSAFWGSVIDWLAAERADPRAASPAEGSVREGEPIRWRRGSPADTVATVVMRNRGSGESDSVSIRFAPGAVLAETPPRAAGTYDVSARGGTSVLVVNPSAEVLPRRPTVTDGPVGTGEAIAEAPRLRGIGWIFAVVILSLCAEWILRRRIGLR